MGNLCGGRFNVGGKEPMTDDEIYDQIIDYKNNINRINSGARGDNKFKFLNNNNNNSNTQSNIINNKKKY